MTRYIIMCAGKGERWDNYLGVDKHNIVIDNETLLHRIVRLLKENGETNIWITRLKQYDLKLDEYFAEIVVSQEHPYVEPDSLNKFFNGFVAWSYVDEICYLYGDVYYTEEAISKIVELHNDFLCFGRIGKSDITGKKYTETYAIKFTDKQRVIEKLDEIAKWYLRKGWLKFSAAQELYLRMADLSLNNVVKHPTCWIDIDDWTEDFDCKEDYENWTLRRKQSQLPV